jgi:hypothetical protein
MIKEDYMYENSTMKPTKNVNWGNGYGRVIEEVNLIKVHHMHV